MTPRRFHTRVIAVVLLFGSLLTAGCELAGPDDRGREAPPETLEEARRLWVRRGFGDYEFRMEHQSSWAPRLQATVFVRNGEVRDLLDVEQNGEPIDPYLSSLALTLYFVSIEELFDVIEDAEHTEVQEMRVDYDARLGYPARMYIRQDASTYVAVRVRAVRPIARG